MVHEKDDWFETVDEVVLTWKDNIYNWIKEVEEDNESRSSRSSSKKSSGRSSMKSSSFSKTKSSNSSLGKTSVRVRSKEEKLKMAELLAEASFAEAKHAAICNTKKLKQTEELAKPKARLRFLMKLRMTYTLLVNMLKETNQH